MLKRFARFLLRSVPGRTAIPILRGPLRGSWWIIGSGVHTYWRGVYEPELSRQIQSLVKPGMNCYDCGANVGYFTLLFSRLVGSTGRVFAIEPVPANAEHIRRHVVMNGLMNVTVIESALVDYNGKASFVADGSTSRVGPEGKLEVECRTIDSLGLPPPNVMKIDVEGAEVELINGADATIRKYRPEIFMSLHIPVSTAYALAARLGSMGYDVTFSKSSYELRATPSRPGQRPADPTRNDGTDTAAGVAR